MQVPIDEKFASNLKNADINKNEPELNIMIVKKINNLEIEAS